MKLSTYSSNVAVFRSDSDKALKLHIIKSAMVTKQMLALPLLLVGLTSFASSQDPARKQADVGLRFADNPQLGTWKLNEAKSKIGAGKPKITTVVHAAVGEAVKITVDGTDGDGKPLHTEWTGKYDGKDYPVIGDPGTDTRSYKKVNDHTLASTSKKGGKVTMRGRRVVSADGQTATVTRTGTDSKSKKFAGTFVYDKQ